MATSVSTRPSFSSLPTLAPLPTLEPIADARISRDVLNAQSPHFLERWERPNVFMRLGKTWDESLGVQQNLNAAGMGRPVELWPSAMVGPDGNTTTTKHLHIVLPEGGPRQTPRSLGVVTSRWKPLQMVDFIEQFDFLFEEFPAHSLLSVSGGAKQALILRPTELPAGKLQEELQMGYALMNNFTGKGGIAVLPIVMRQVCTNGLIAMVEDKRSTIRVPHTDRGLLHMEQRAALRRSMLQAPARIVENYERLAARSMSLPVLESIIQKVHAEPRKPMALLAPDKFSSEALLAATSDYENSLSRIQRQRAMVRELYEMENDTAPVHLRGSRWLAWQAIAEEADYNHFGGQPKTAVPMFFGQPAKEQEKAYRLLMA